MKANHEFQVFVKPIGASCNLSCHYCYYRDKGELYRTGASLRMSREVLEEYILQHSEACPTKVINFCWHGGEPTLLGIDYFRTIVAIERKYCPPGKIIRNGIQTNGTLLNEEWCRFLKDEGFYVGISLDGPREFHDCYRVTGKQEPTYDQVMRGYELLTRYDIPCDILCVVHRKNVYHPEQVYRFFRSIDARYIEFLPLVERPSQRENDVTDRSVPAEAFGVFLCTIFDEWLRHDVGNIKIQIFEEMAERAMGMEQALCVFQKTCGTVPVIEHNGDFFSCDHFVDEEHRLGNILETPLVILLESPTQRSFGEKKQSTLPHYCRVCEFLEMCNGGCPKDRIARTPDGERGLNYLCAGYRRFFNHIQPFVAELRDLWSRTSSVYPLKGVPSREAGTGKKPGRNDPCPCGSGRKYKKCCLPRAG